VQVKVFNNLDGTVQYNVDRTNGDVETANASPYSLDVTEYPNVQTSEMSTTAPLVRRPK